MQRALNNILVGRELGKKYFNKPQRVSMISTFNEFCKNVLPQVEEKIETTILRELYNSTKNPMVRKEILNSYKRRKLDVHYKAIQKIQEEDIVEIEKEEEAELTYTDPTIKDLSRMTIQNVGFPFEVSYDNALKYLSTGFFGYKEYIPHFYLKSERVIFMFSYEMYKVVRILERLRDSNEFLFQNNIRQFKNRYQLKALDPKKQEKSFVLFNPFTQEDQETLLEEIENMKDLEYLYQNEDLFLNISNILRDTFRTIVIQECNKWVQLPKEERQRRALAKKPEKFHNLILDEPDNIYSNYLNSLNLNDHTGETLYEQLKQDEIKVMQRDKQNALLVAKVSGQLPKNEILINEDEETKDVEYDTQGNPVHEIDERDWTHLEWDDPNMPFAERDRRNREVEILNQIFAECFVFDGIVNFLAWNFHIEEVRDRILDGPQRHQMFQCIMNQIKTHPKREFIASQKPEVYFQLMEKIDIGGYLLDCSVFDPNLTESIFRKKFKESIGVASETQVEERQMEEFIRKKKNYEGFDVRVDTDDKPYYNLTPFKYTHNPNYEMFHDIRHKSKKGKMDQDFKFIIKKYQSDGKLEAKPIKTGAKPQKKVIPGSMKDYERVFYNEDEQETPLNFTLKEMQKLHLRTPRDLDEGSIHNFSGHQSGVLLWGEQGAGKSGTLLGLSLWAYYNNWIVLKIPSVFELTQIVKKWKGLELLHNHSGPVLDR